MKRTPSKSLNADRNNHCATGDRVTSAEGDERRVAFEWDLKGVAKE